MRLCKLDLSDSGHGYYEDGNEPLGSISDGEYL
jgi:hypothetical protein